MGGKVRVPRGEKRKNKANSKKPTRVTSTIVLPLHYNGRDAAILDQRFAATGRLRNATLGTLLKRADTMRADPAWAEVRTLSPAEVRSERYHELRKKHGVNAGDAVRAAFGHWQASHWMPDVLDSRIAIALAREVLTSVDNWLFGLTERPRFKPSADRSFVMGNDNKAGLRVKKGRVVWPTRIAREALSMELDLSELTRRRRTDFEQRTIRRVGIVREMIGTTPRLMAHVVVEGPPFRDPDYLASIPPTTGCIDVNVSNISVQGPAGTSLRIALYDDGTDLRATADARYERRLQRRLNRSRRAMNPHAFRQDGTSLQGVRQPKRSKRGRVVQAHLANLRRRRAAQQAQWQTQVARQILKVTGCNLGYEDVNFATWARRRGHFRWGKRLRLTTPGAIQARVPGEARLLKGTLTPLPLILALSSRCICGARATKPLSQRSHHCLVCGFGPVDRDLLSALLGREATVTGRTIDLGPTPFRGRRTRSCDNMCRQTRLLSELQGTLLSNHAATRAWSKYPRFVIEAMRRRRSLDRFRRWLIVQVIDLRGLRDGLLQSVGC